MTSVQVEQGQLEKRHSVKQLLQCVSIDSARTTKSAGSSRRSISPLEILLAALSKCRFVFSLKDHSRRGSTSRQCSDEMSASLLFAKALRLNRFMSFFMLCRVSKSVPLRALADFLRMPAIKAYASGPRSRRFRRATLR